VVADNDKASDNSSELLRVARERFKLVVDAESEIREAFLDDFKFRAGDQWPENIKVERKSDNRPALVINRIPQHVRQITNDQRQNRPSIKVAPVDDNADVETAKIFQGVIRHIERNSSADVSYDTACEHQVESGRGFFRFITDYSDPLSFEQDILFKRIRNPLSVYMDPNSQEPDGSDMNWCFVVEDVLKEDFKEQFKDDEFESDNYFESIGSNSPFWIDKNTIRIAEYFYKEYETAEIALLNNGQVIKTPKAGEKLPDGVEIVSKRTTKIPVIRWCKITGCEVLEKTDWLGKWIPIVPVFGDELDIDGKVQYEGIIRHAKDPQRMYNYWASAETEMISQSPRTPFIGAEGQFAGHEATWKTANTKSHAFMQYKPVSLLGQPLPPPQRQVFEPPIQAITHARMLSAEDIKATTGQYDASLGNKSNEQSGIAIQRRSIQSQTGNFHFMDNLSRSIRHGGRILIDLIPKIYDTARAIRIIGEDGQEEVVRINEIFEKDGKNIKYDFSIGKYDVAVDTGPSFATKRQEAVAAMLDFVKANPQAPIWDLLVENMDWPGKTEIAERLRKTLPPGMAEDKNKKKNPIPPEAQQQMAQMNQLIEQLTNEVHQSADIIENKKLELESKERIEMSKIQADIEINLAKIGSVEAVELLRQEVSQLENRLQLVKFNQPIDAEEPQGNQPGQPSQPIEQEMNPDAGGQSAMAPEQIQSTGGQSPGQSMEENHD
jgi:hypothetical protein